ncbi:hypothetical protein LDENG_00202680, partial [Lucifuga dentata]
MIFKPAKSRSLVLRKGRVEDKYRFHLDGVLIPSVSEKPVKSLGKIFDGTQSMHTELKSYQQWTSSLEHILSCCPKALGEGRYAWHHDQVLKAVADTICTGIQRSKHQLPARHNITFVRAGEKPQAERKVSTGLLALASDWQLKVDLGRQLKFPEHIAKTSLRPDLVLTSVSTKQIVLLELIVPWEDRIEEAHERKKAKYLELVGACRESGW